MSPISYPKCCQKVLNEVQDAWDIAIETYPDVNPTDPLVGYCPDHGIIKGPKAHDPTSQTDPSKQLPIGYENELEEDTDPELDIIISDKLNAKAISPNPGTIGLRLVKRLTSVSLCSSMAIPAHGAAPQGTGQATRSPAGGSSQPPSPREAPQGIGRAPQGAAWSTASGE